MTVIAALRGGTRDGETTTVEEGVTRLLAPSAAPGLLDVYTASEDRVDVPGNPEPAVVFVHTGQESASDTAPELLHQPSE